MVLSTVMGLVCVVLIVALYVFSGGWKLYGGISGLWKWLKQGGLSNPIPRSNQSMVHRPDGAAEVADILDDIYREFMTKLEEKSEVLHSEFGTSVSELQDTISSLEKRIEYIEAERAVTEISKEPDNHTFDDQNIKKAVVESKKTSERKTYFPEDEPVYFRILDAIRQGEHPDDIANSLGVTIQDVDMVRKIMETPFTDKPN